jgi:hypothetical protein
VTDASSTADAPGDPADDRPASDWDEQDLLTIDEAGARLVAELSTLRELAGAEPDDAARRQLAKRVDLLEEALRSIMSGPTDLARIRPSVRNQPPERSDAT